MKLGLFVALPLAIASLARAQAPAPAPSATSLARLAAGLRAERGGEHASAVAQLAPVAAERNQLGDYAHLYLARAQAGLGDDAVATTTLETLLRIYPTSLLTADAALELGNLRRRAGDCNQAAVLFALARERSRSATVSANATLRLAECLERSERAGDARRYLLELRDEWPLEDADREARARLAALDAAHPELVPRPSLDGAVAEAKRLAKEGEVTAAVALLERTVRDNAGSPDALDAQLELAGLLKRAGRPDDREEMLRAVVRASPRSQAGTTAAFTLAQALWNRGKNRETIAVLDQLEALSPPASLGDEILYMRARIQEEAHAWAGAVTLYQRVVKEYPRADRTADALWRWTWISYRHDPPAKHLATFEQTRALARAPEVGRRIRYWQARALAAAGQAGRASQIFDALAGEDPNGYYGRLAALGVNGSIPAPAPLAADDTASPAWRALTPLAALDGLGVGDPPLTGGDVGEHLVRARWLADAMLDDLALDELRAAESGASLDDATRIWMARFYASIGSANRALKAAQKARAGGLDGEGHALLAGNPFERFLYPLPYPHHLRRLAAAEGLDPLLAAALIRNESLFDPRAHSPADARGLMQIIPPTARRLATEVGFTDFELGDLFQPRINLTLGCHYLASLLTRYHDDVERAVASYNAGEDAVDRWTARDPSLKGAAFAETIPYAETRNYVRNVIRDWLHYRELYLGAV
ncbi:MAG: transglycosylase SLT domain-containing protein [Deltaproteobacteria bacterium]|nr:transglycosylase SLT domain-containing protein [Deltaproteobacteria bacterium]